MNRLCCQLRDEWRGQVEVNALCWGPWGPTQFGAGMVTAETEAKFAAKGVTLVGAASGRQLFVEAVARAAGRRRSRSSAARARGRRTRPRVGGDRARGADGARRPARADARPAGAHHLPTGEQLLAVRIDARHALSRPASHRRRAGAARGGGDGDHGRRGANPVAGMEGRRGARLPPDQGRGDEGGGARPAGRDPAAALRQQRRLRGHGDDPLRARRRPLLVHYRCRRPARAAGCRASSRARPRCTRPRSSASPPPTTSCCSTARASRSSRRSTASRSAARSRACGPRGRPSGSPACRAAHDQWIFDPALVDAAAQMALLWARSLRGESCLPARFGRVARLREQLPPRMRMEFELIPAPDPSMVRGQRLFPRRRRPGRAADRGDGMHRQRRAQPARRHGQEGSGGASRLIDDRPSRHRARASGAARPGADRDHRHGLHVSAGAGPRRRSGATSSRGVDAVGEPAAAWDAERYLDSGRIKTAFGGYLKELFRFDPREFGIMPNSLDGGEPDQFLALRIARDALADAGYLERPRPPRHRHRPRPQHLPASRPGRRSCRTRSCSTRRWSCSRRSARRSRPTQLAEMRALLKSKLPPSNADIAPGPGAQRDDRPHRQPAQPEGPELPARCRLLVVAARGERGRRRAAQRPQPDDAGRRRQRLAAGRSDGDLHPARRAERRAARCGRSTPAATARCSAKAWAWSCSSAWPTRSPTATASTRCCAASARRATAAARACSRPASTARRWRSAAPTTSTGVDPASVSLIEAHGTGIPLGDKTEIAALKNVFGERRTRAGRDRDRLGQVDDQPLHSGGRHRRPDQDGAGAAPPRAAADACANRSTPSSASPTTPFYVNTEAGAVDRAGSAASRRAGIDSFGFGGINVHAIVEEAPAQAKRPERCTPWPAELVRALGRDAARPCSRSSTRLAAALARHEGTPARRNRRRRWQRADRGEPVRLALVAKDCDVAGEERRAGA